MGQASEIQSANRPEWSRPNAHIGCGVNYAPRPRVFYNPNSWLCVDVEFDFSMAEFLRPTILNRNFNGISRFSFPGKNNHKTSELQ